MTGTSRTALLAQTVSSRQATRVAILALLTMHGPQTDEELVQNFAILRTKQTNIAPRSPSSIRTARHALVTRYLVRDTGDRRETSYGFPATVWALAED